MDASTVGKQPTELLWLYSPEHQLGGWAPPLAANSGSVPPCKTEQEFDVLCSPRLNQGLISCPSRRLGC